MEQQQMTPQQALSILDQASAQAPLPRLGHVQVQQALEVLAKIIAPKPATPAEPVE